MPVPEPRKRQAPHLGHEYQLPSGAWGIRVSLGGRRHFVSGRTRTEAREKRDALLQRHRQGGLATDPRAGREPVLARLRDWLEGKRAEVEPSTWLRYRLAVEGHWAPLLGGVTLRHIADDPASLRASYATLGARLSAKSVREAHLVLRQALQQAVADGALARNPLAAGGGVKPPKVRRQEVRALTPGEVERLLSAAVEDGPEGDWRCLWLLGLHTGLRLGELLGLCWREVEWPPQGDLKPGQGAVSVRRVLAVALEGPPVLRPYPKRHASFRRVPIEGEVVAALRAQRVRQTEERLRARQWAGVGEAHGGLVFATNVGTAVLATNAVRKLIAAAEAAGVGHVSPHVLRHTYCSALLAAGRPITEVAMLMGHGSPATTMAIYASYIKADVGASAEVLARFYGRG